MGSASIFSLAHREQLITLDTNTVRNKHHSFMMVMLVYFEEEINHLK